MFEKYDFDTWLIVLSCISGGETLSLIIHWNEFFLSIGHYYFNTNISRYFKNIVINSCNMAVIFGQYAGTVIAMEF